MFVNVRMVPNRMSYLFSRSARNSDSVIIPLNSFPVKFLGVGFHDLYACACMDMPKGNAPHPSHRLKLLKLTNVTRNASSVVLDSNTGEGAIKFSFDA